MCVDDRNTPGTACAYACALICIVCDPKEIPLVALVDITYVKV